MQDIISNGIDLNGHTLVPDKEFGEDFMIPVSIGPILLKQFKTKFEIWDAHMDEFYSKIESQRAAQ